MTNETEKVVSIAQGLDRANKYDLPKDLMSSKEESKTEHKALYKGVVLSIIALVVIAGLVWRVQLSHKPASREQVLTPAPYSVVGNADSKLYHLPKDSHYLEFLQGNKARENRICFHKEV